MSRMRWVRRGIAGSSGCWHECRIARGAGYSIDEFTDRTFIASFNLPNEDIRIGPFRKTLRGAHNDCKRHAKKLRAALVEFDRAKLP